MNDRLKKTERLFKTMILLSTNRSGYTAKELARKFEVDQRTIYRDFDVLGEDLNVPVYNDGKRWKIDEKRFLPPVQFTLPEALNIFLSARLMLNYAHRYDPNIDAAFTKLSAVLPAQLAEQVQKTLTWMQKLPKDEKHLKILNTVCEAWVNQRRVKIGYRPLVSVKASERLIEPYYIEPAAPGHASYIIGFCHYKKAIRTFKVERIESATLTDETYKIPSGFDANEYLGSSWGIVVDGEIKTVKFKINDPNVIRIMSETVWHPSQAFKKQKDGSTIMTLKVTDTYELLSWILSWGESIEVLEPLEIRRTIVKSLGAMKKIYLK